MTAPRIPHKKKNTQAFGNISVLKNKKHIKPNPVIPNINAILYPLFITSKASYN